MKIYECIECGPPGEDPVRWIAAPSLDAAKAAADARGWSEPHEIDVGLDGDVRDEAAWINIGCDVVVL